MEPGEYLAEIKARLVASAVVVEVTMVEEYVLPDRGYCRARLQLSNHDFLEVAEYFVVASGLCMTQRYRYQWMDETQSVLRKRWDNVEALRNFSMRFAYVSSRIKSSTRLMTCSLPSASFW